MRSFALVLLVLLGAASPARAGKPTPLGIAIWDPLGFRGIDDDITGLSVNLLVGRSNKMFGLEVSGFGSGVEHRAAGVQIAGLFNFAHTAPALLQAAGLGNYIDTGAGIQLAGLVNFTEQARGTLQVAGAANIGSGRALQVALGGNYSKGPLKGGQISIAYNMARTDLTGVQVAFGNTVQEGDLLGLQVGITNVNHYKSRTSGNMVEETTYIGSWIRGLQIGVIVNHDGSFEGLQAGFANIVRATMRGVSVGIINSAASVHGLQLGFINLTKQLRGLQIGVFNIATKAKIPFTVLVNADF